MARLEPAITFTQPVWWLAQQAPIGWGARSLWGGGPWGVAGGLWGDGVWGGSAWGDGAFGDGVWGGADVWGGWPWYQGTLTVQTADSWGGTGVWGDNLWGDSRANPNPFLEIGMATGFSPDDWGDNDPSYQIPDGIPRYWVFNGGACALADGTTVTYGDTQNAAAFLTQGGPAGLLNATNTTATLFVFGTVQYTVAVHAVLPVWPGRRRYRLILRWLTGHSLANPSPDGWMPWDGVTAAPSGVVNPVIYETHADIDDPSCGVAWPSTAGAWPASVTVGVVASPCPSAGAFTVHT